MDSAAAAFGLVIETAPPDEIQFIYLWPENLESWNLFQQLQSQWQYSMEVATGLQYAGVESFMRLLGIRGEKRRMLFEDILILERATLDAWSERRDREKRG